MNCFRLSCSGRLDRFCTWAYGTWGSGDAGTRSARHVLRVPHLRVLPAKSRASEGYRGARFVQIFSHTSVSGWGPEGPSPERKSPPGTGGRGSVRAPRRGSYGLRQWMRASLLEPLIPSFLGEVPRRRVALLGTTKVVGTVEAAGSASRTPPSSFRPEGLGPGVEESSRTWRMSPVQASRCALCDLGR